MDSSRVSKWSVVLRDDGIPRPPTQLAHLTDAQLEQLADAASAILTDRIVRREGLDGDASAEVAA